MSEIETGQPKWSVIAYWIATMILGSVFLSAGFFYLTGGAEQTAGIARLGYPQYIMTILGVWKVLGGLVLFLPGLALLKEWAYAGILFNLTGASASNAFAGMGTFHILGPIIILLIALVSDALRPRTRRLSEITWRKK